MNLIRKTKQIINDLTKDNSIPFNHIPKKYLKLYKKDKIEFYKEYIQFAFGIHNENDIPLSVELLKHLYTLDYETIHQLKEQLFDHIFVIFLLSRNNFDYGQFKKELPPLYKLYLDYAEQSRIFQFIFHSEIEINLENFINEVEELEDVILEHVMKKPADHKYGMTEYYTEFTDRIREQYEVYGEEIENSKVIDFILQHISLTDLKNRANDFDKEDTLKRQEFYEKYLMKQQLKNF